MYKKMMFVAFLVLLLTLETRGYSNSIKKTVICEHKSKTLCCDPGKAMFIVRANYGRTDKNTCPSIYMKTTKCYAWNSLGKVTSLCHNKRSCTLQASNGVFGDPCRGTFKYLYVEYRCEPSGVKTALVCEHQSKMICCEPGKVIFIEKANYGRRNKDICPHSAIRTTYCSASTSLVKVKQTCNNKKSCKLEAKNSVFGDPCYGTFKYLDVTYRCEKPSGMNTVLICEHQSKTISCNPGNVIVIVRANYGRTNRNTCLHSSIKTTKCFSSNSLWKVKRLCNNRGACRLEAKNSVFGDPCYGTFKYLDVAYRCEPYGKLCGGRCKPHSSCVNNYCICDKGYTGNGYYRCTAKPCGGKCKDHSTCTNNVCVCNDGYTGDGSDKCIRLPCAGKCVSNAVCKNGKCVCMPDYIGEGYKRCSLPCNGQCKEHEYCKDEQCVCRQGLKKDPVKGCRLPCYGRCGRYAKCDVDRDVCKCKEGWTGDPKDHCKRSGSCNGWRCAKNAECIDDRCVCKEGYFGHGDYSCEEKCMCTVSGDPHYKLFDGQTIHFQGICKYLLTKYSATKCAFSVEVKNERRGKNKRVSYTRMLDVNIYGHTFRFLKGNKVLMDGVYKYLPVVDNKKRYKLYFSGSHVRMTTDCGVTILWNGISTIQVAVPREYGPYLTGICGNCNGKRDDFITKDKRDVSNNKNKFKLIGESYAVVDDSDKPDKNCVTEELDNTCTPKLLAIARTTQFCGFLATATSTSPFAACVAAHRDEARRYYDFCVYDVCEYEKEEDIVKDVACRSLEGFASFCQSEGFHIRWRGVCNCPLECGPNKVYSDAVSGCPATCMDIEAPKNCQLPDTEGCTCKPGYVESGDECVKQVECGCFCHTMGYLPLYKSWMTNQCTEMIKCDIRKGFADLEHSKISCHANAYCGKLNGVPSCICANGYIGDGIKTCSPAKYKLLCCNLSKEKMYSHKCKYMISGSAFLHGVCVGEAYHE